VTLRRTLDRYLPYIDEAMRRILEPSADDFKAFYGMLHYHQGWVDHNLEPTTAGSGKRVRPVICLLCCEAAGGDFERALPLAAGVELLHSFSLVHDDVQDGSLTRRHRPTVWSIWGQAQAINVGDALFAAAHRSVYDLRECCPAETTLRIADEFDRTCLRLCEGQYLDMVFEGEQMVTMSRYQQMIERKTAALIAFSAWSGATVGGAGDSRAECYREFGRQLGLAFQVQDDILGVWGDERETGKSASSDVVSGKKTLPLIYAAAALPTAMSEELAAIYSKQERGEADVARARELFDVSGAREYCAGLAREHHRHALLSLEQAKPTASAGRALRELVSYLGDRRR